MSAADRALRLTRAHDAIARWVAENRTELFTALRCSAHEEDRELAEELRELLAEWEAAGADLCGIAGGAQ